MSHDANGRFPHLGNRQEILRSADKPPRLELIAKDVPPELKALNHWITWKWIARSGKWDKLPFSAESGRQTAWDQSDNWTSFATARAVLDSADRYDGLGFVLTPLESEEIRIVGLDLDDVRDPSTGELTPQAEELVRQIDSYAERTPSGTGIRIILACDSELRWPKLVGGIEVLSSGYITVTGQHLAGSPREVRRRDGRLLKWVQEHQEGPSTSPETPARGGSYWADRLAGLTEAGQLAIVEEMLGFIPNPPSTDPRRENDYERYLRIGMAVNSVFPGPEGLKLWLTWASQNSVVYDPDDCQRRWESFHPRSDGVGIGTLATIAREAGWVSESDTSPLDDFAEVFSEPGSGEEPPRSEFKSLIRWADLVTPPEPDWLWEHILFRGGLSQITGVWKAGKSTLLGHYFAEAEDGGELIGKIKRHKILLVSEESPFALNRRRDQLELRGTNVFVDALPFGGGKPSHQKWRKYLQARAEDIKRLGLSAMVIDSFPSVSPVVEEADASETINAIHPLRDLAEKLQIAILLIYHPRKSGGPNAMATRGSGALQAVTDINVSFKPIGEAENDTRRKVETQSRISVPISVRIRLNDDGFYEQLDEKQDVREIRVKRLNQYAAELGAILPKRPPGVTRQQLMTQWGSVESERTVRHILAQLATENMIYKLDRPGVKGGPRYFHIDAAARIDFANIQGDDVYDDILS